MKPMNVNNRQEPVSIKTSVGGSGGINLLAPPELAGDNFVQANEGYNIETNGGLTKLEGNTELFTVAGNAPGTMLKEWEETLWIYGYDNNVAAYDTAADTSTVIKADFTTTDNFTGFRYGGYFFTGNGGDKVGRITRTLDYDGQTANFTVGLTVTGTTSGATGVILEDSDAGATGTLTLGEVSGTFANDEALTDSSTGAAVVNGILDFTYTEITDAPKAKVLAGIGSRAFAGNLNGDIVGAKDGTPETLVWAKQDDGTNPPFGTWTTAATPPVPTDPSSLRYRNAGNINSIVPLGGQVVSFHKGGRTGFRLDTVDEATTGLAQTTIVDFQDEDLGAFKAIHTPKGIYLVNKSGLWRSLSGGNTSQPFSAEDEQVSRILGEELIEGLNFDDADIVYIEEKSWVMVTCKKDSSVNNYVFWHNIENGSFGTIPDWQINRFMEVDGTIYGIGSLATTVYKLFDGYEVEGTTMSTLYKQEVNLSGGLDEMYSMSEFTIKGFMNPLSNIRVYFDAYDDHEKLTQRKEFTWTVSGGLSEVEGFNKAGHNKSSSNGGKGSNELIESRGSKRVKIHNFKRLIVRITSEDRVPHKITYFNMKIANRGKNRRTQNIS